MNKNPRLNQHCAGVRRRRVHRKTFEIIPNNLQIETNGHVPPVEPSKMENTETCTRSQLTEGSDNPVLHCARMRRTKTAVATQIHSSEQLFTQRHQGALNRKEHCRLPARRETSPGTNEHVPLSWSKACHTVLSSLCTARSSDCQPNASEIGVNTQTVVLELRRTKEKKLSAWQFHGLVESTGRHARRARWRSVRRAASQHQAPRHIPPTYRSSSSTEDLPQTTPSSVLRQIREDLRPWGKILMMSVFSSKKRC